MNKKFIRMLQQRTGQLAIGRFTLLNQCAPRVVRINEQYLQLLEDKTINLLIRFQMEQEETGVPHVRL